MQIPKSVYLGLKFQTFSIFSGLHNTKKSWTFELDVLSSSEDIAAQKMYKIHVYITNCSEFNSGGTYERLLKLYPSGLV